MKKTSTLFLITLAIIAVGYLIWQARSDRKKANDLLAEFKRVNSSLDSLNSSLDNNTGLKNGNSYLMPLTGNIIALIDSLKSGYLSQLENPAPGTAINPKRQDVKRLLAYMKEFNKSQWDMMDSAIPDTINYWNTTVVFDENKWYSSWFEDQPVEISITYLGLLRNEMMKFNH